MKNTKNILNLFVAVVLLGALATSCGSSSYHSGCPGKDRPSYRGYGMTEPAQYDFQVNPQNNNDKVCAATVQIDA